MSPGGLHPSPGPWSVTGLKNHLAATGGPAVTDVLEVLGAGDLYFRKADRAVFILREQGGTPTRAWDSG